MELITTHMGADFDAFASMLAARRLHPGAELFFPGSREESVRRMLEAGLIEFAELKHKQVDPAAVSRVILCDIRQAGRIGVVGEWLAADPAIEVWAYDHHPPSAADLAPAGGRVDPAVGATSTLMVEEFRRRGLEPTADEATVLLAGIHEDTGSLTHATTSRRDCEAAGWLLDRGADLAVVRRFAVPGLDPARLDVLHRMTRALEVFRIHDQRVGVVALDLGEYVDELAPLASRCRELFELPLLFALFGEGEPVTVIARGEAPGVDLGRLLADFAGGGGHATAASARLRAASVIAVRERLLAHLEAVLPPAARAADLAVRDFFVVPAGTSIGRAKELINQRRVNAAPVAAPGAGEKPGADAPLVGAVTRQILDAALQHGLAERPVETVMDPDLEWVEPDSPADDVGRRILDRHPRFVLVGDRAAGRAVGLITRMQVLRHLQGRLVGFADRLERRTRERAEERKGGKEIAELLAERLPPALARRVEAVARVSRRHGIPVYLVGGLVRDLLLGRENRDLDLVVEGDGPHLARLLAAELGGRVREHRAFLTAVVVDGEGFHLDVASARSEFYRAPAALPEVETSAIRQDLYRRDFTINTLAVRLGPEEAPVLIDYFGGRRDLEAKTLRVLHSLSFIDDPTRVLRAVRLEQRLGFTISPETLQLVAVALSERIFDRLSGSRLREELIPLLGDPALALRGVERLGALGLLAVVHRDLAATDAVRLRLRAAVGAFDWFGLQGLAEPPVELWRLALGALLDDLPAAAVAAAADRLMLAGEDRRIVVGGGERRAAARQALGRDGLAPHRISDVLAGLPGEDLLLLMAAGDDRVRERVRRELCELRRFALAIGGADLLAAGAAPGPAVGEALRRTRRARLDGEIGAAEELEFALRALAAAGGAVERPATDGAAGREGRE
jgi:tRNA nucleotidyltransferase (CCA-adding enzyme)